MANANAGPTATAASISRSAKDLDQLWSSHLLRENSGPYFSAVYPHIDRYLVQHRCRGSLLDLGCGFGGKSAVFAEMGFRVTGLDGDSQRIARARKVNPHISFLHHDISTGLPFPDNSFDVLFSCSVFQYLDHARVLAECRRILKPGGTLILTENLKNNPVTRAGRTLLKLRKHTYQSYPWNHFTYGEMKALRPSFQDTLLEVFHFSSPLAHAKSLQRFYPLFSKLDRQLLRFRLFRDLAWMALFCGKTKYAGIENSGRKTHPW